MKTNNQDYFKKVYEVVRKIPPGRVTTYGAIARYLGSPGASRMVGWAMNMSHFETDYVPAHRVVNRLGMLTGKSHFEGPDVMKNLLTMEGHEIKNDRIKDFQKTFWDPVRELGL